MKKTILFTIALFCYAIGIAQSFNYQAVVKDAGGNPVTNQAIGVRVSLERASAYIYQETHTVTSDANGLINFAVGTGTNDGYAPFSTINWSTQDFNMVLEVDITGGTTYVNIGTTFLRQVPYALYAASAPSTNYFTLNNNILSNVPEIADPNNNALNDFVVGAHLLDGSDPFVSKMFFDVSKGAFRAGRLALTSVRWDDVNRGNFSAAFGFDTSATGASTFASGNRASATGDNSFAHGVNALARKDNSITLGTTLQTGGENSVAIGTGLSPNSFGETHIGTYSRTEVLGDSINFVPTDRLFVIGNGTDLVTFAGPSNALVMLKNGNTTLNGQLTIDGDNQGVGTAYTLPGQDGTTNQVMSTDGSGNLTWVSPSSSSLPNGGNNGNVLSTDGTGNYAWVNNDVLPAGGNTGEVLSTDGSGNYTWIADAVNDADADATNEIELPPGGINGQVLATDGSGVYSWTNSVSGGFTTTGSTTSNSPGTIATDDFVFGSTELHDIGGVSDNSRMYFDKSQAAFRAGRASSGQWNPTNVGLGSVAIGIDNTSSNSATVALGKNNVSSGFEASTAIGINNTATRSAATAIGFGNTASGSFTVAMGRGLNSEAVSQVTLGAYNTLLAGSPNAFVPTERLFVVGNGTSGVATSDALVMLKNGNTTLNGNLTIDGDNQGAGTAYTLPAQDGTANYVMTTDGSGNATWQAASAAGAFSTTANVTSNAPGTIATDSFVFGSSQLDDDGASGLDNNRMFYNKAQGAFRAGSVAADQWDTSKTGNFSTAFGFNTTASGLFSAAIGNGTQATGAGSFVTGITSTASGTSSIAMGTTAVASGEGSVALGSNLTANSYRETQLGQYTTSASGDANSFVSTDRLLVVGNGVDAANTSDALVMLKNGNTTLNGQLTIDGDNAGAGSSYTLPAQDGTASQVMTTDGAGNTSWTTVSSGTSLPAGGTNGDQLTTNGAGVYSWTADAVNDADADPTNEIELPPGGTNGQVLSTNGSGTYSWSDNESAAPEAFSNPTFTTNWGNYGNGFEDPSFYKDRKRVYIAGIATKTMAAIANGDIMFTLPTNYRPAKRRGFIASSSLGLIRIDVDTSGNVIYLGGSIAAGGFVFLDGISFRVN